MELIDSWPNDRIAPTALRRMRLCGSEYPPLWCYAEYAAETRVFMREYTSARNLALWPVSSYLERSRTTIDSWPGDRISPEGMERHRRPPRRSWRSRRRVSLLEVLRGVPEDGGQTDLTRQEIADMLENSDALARYKGTFVKQRTAPVPVSPFDSNGYGSLL